VYREGLILDVARRAGRSPSAVPGSSGESVIPCPRSENHRNGDAHPSCRLNPEKNTWFCDVCQVGGGVKDLAEKLGVDLSGMGQAKSRASTTRQRRAPAGREPRPLLFVSGGSISAETAHVFEEGLGKSYTLETWAAFGVLEGVVHPEGLPDRSEVAVAFPMPDGGVHAYRYSRADKRKRWCFANRGKPGLLVVGLDRPDPVLLCEGEWDAMRAYELGYAVATGTGAGIFDEAWAPSLVGRQVAIVYDVDPAGVKGGQKALSVLRPHATTVWDILLPLSGDPERDGKDLSDFVAIHGPDAFRELIDTSAPRALKAIGGCVSEGAAMTAAELLEAMRSSFPGLEPALHAGLALQAYLCFEGSNRPCALFYLGPPSSGKSLVDRLFLPTPECPEINEYVYRCDDFTPASFVSRAASVSTKRLAEIDLLPKLANKVLNTKELAPIFRGKADDLIRTFAVLTSVLDGDGLVTAGGSVGTRGYSDPIFFCWLGATTPLSPHTWKVMAALGPRILFYETAAIEPTLEDLVRAQEDEITQEEYAMRLRVNGFLREMYKRWPPRSLPENSIGCSETARRQIALYSRFLARLRAGLTLRDPEEAGHKEARYEPPSKEHEYRLVKTLNRLARASALVMGRKQVDEEDLELIRDIVLSSAPETRRKVAVALLELTADAIGRGEAHPVAIGAGTIARAIQASLPTARHYAEELDVLQIARYDRAAFGDSGGGLLVLKEDLREIVDQHTHPLIAFKAIGSGSSS
jgi:hypothetical protein